MHLQFVFVCIFNALWKPLILTDKSELVNKPVKPGKLARIKHERTSTCPEAGTYASRLLANLNKLRQSTQNGSLCDVEIVAGLDSGIQGLGGAVRQVQFAHRSVLAASSPYFNAMFTSDVLEAKRERIVIQSLDGETLAGLLDFIYTGEIRVTNENVQDLLIAGDMIELSEVVEICTEHLVRQLEPSNAVGIFRFAADHNCLLLKEAALRYLQCFPTCLE